MQAPKLLLTYPGAQIHLGVLHEGLQKPMFKLLQVGWHPLSPQDENTSLAPAHV